MTDTGAKDANPGAELKKYLELFEISDDAIPDLYVDIDIDGKAHMSYEAVIGTATTSTLRINS